jgi:hypothetical protein
MRKWNLFGLTLMAATAGAAMAANLGKLRNRRGRASDAPAFYYRRIDSAATPLPS